MFLFWQAESLVSQMPTYGTAIVVQETLDFESWTESADWKYRANYKVMC